MASPVGAQYVFFEPNGTGVSVSLTPNGSNLPAPVPGNVNIEVFTATPGGLAAGYQGSAFAAGAGVNNTTVFGPTSLQLLAGNYAVSDITGDNNITLGSGNQSVVGAVGDTITGSSGAAFIDASAGSIAVRIGSAGGSDNIFSGNFDTIMGGSDAATILGAAGDTIDLAGSSGTAFINAMAGHESVTLGSGAATVIGAIGDTITAGSGAAGIVATMGNAQITIGSSGGSDTILSGGGDTILGGAAAATIIGAAGDTINLTGGTGSANINALAGQESVTLGSGPATVFGAGGDTISLGASSSGFVIANLGGMSIQIGSSGADTIFDTGSTGGNTITAASGGTASANVILAAGDKIDLTGGMGNATVRPRHRVLLLEAKRSLVKIQRRLRTLHRQVRRQPGGQGGKNRLLCHVQPPLLGTTMRKNSDRNVN